MNNPYYYRMEEDNTGWGDYKITEEEIREQNKIVEIKFHRIAHLEDYEMLTCTTDILEERIERSGKCYY